MNTKEAQALLDSYFRWAKDRTVLHQVSDQWVEIGTPYLDRHNDCLDIYLRRDGDKLLLTDNGYIIDDLRASGCSLDTDRRRELLRVTLNGFGVRENAGALEVSTSPESFPARKHALIQAMLAVGDMFFTTQSIVESLFYEDVLAWLRSSEVRFTEQKSLAGRSGLTHAFHFIIPASSRQPERYVQALSNPTRDAAERAYSAWFDTSENRPKDSKGYAIINDRDQLVPGRITDALANYGIKPVLWSKRENARVELAA